MYPFLRKQTVGVGIPAVLLGLSCFVNMAQAWQFRDLDTSAPKKRATSKLIDLIPTEQEFIAPVVDATELDELKAVASEPLPQETLPPENSVCLAQVDQQMLSSADGLVKEIDDKDLSAAIRRARLAQLRRRG